MKNKNSVFSKIYSYAIKKVARLMKVPVKAVDKFLTTTVKTFLITSVVAMLLWFVSPWMFNGNRISVVAMRLIIVLFSLAGFLLRVKLSWREMRETPDSAEYIADIPTTRLNNIHGLVLGVNEEGEYAVSPEGEEAMALLVGPPGSGKTSAFVIPSIRFWGHNCRTNHTVFAIDIAGDIYKNTSAYRKRKNVVYIGANNALESASYDILYDIDCAETEEEKLERIELLAQNLLPDDGNSKNSFFIREGRKMLIASILHYYHLDCDFIDICKKIVNSSTDELLNKLYMSKNKMVRSYVSGFIGNNPMTNASCKQDCDDAVKVFVVHKSLGDIIHRPKAGQRNVNPHSLETEDIFIRVDENKLDTYKAVLSVITAQTINYLTERKLQNDSPTVLMMIDEFARLNRLSNIQSALMTIRKHRVRICLCFQSISSLDRLYGPNGRKEIIDCCNLRIIMQANDPDTQEFFSRIIGEKTITKRRYKVQFLSGEGYTMDTEKVRNVTPEELGYMGDSVIVTHPTGWARLRKAYYFEMRN